jgi:hypothetical protein
MLLKTHADFSIEKWPEYPPYKMPYAVKVPWEMGFGDQLGDVREY